MALVGNRDRRADEPDSNNRCYAEPAPRQRDVQYQADHCYSPRFAACSVFLGWAARNAAEPTFVTDAAEKAWGSGITSVEDAATPTEPAEDPDEAPAGTPEGGLFGSAGAGAPDDAVTERASDAFDWVPAAAWSSVPYDEQAEAEAEELAAIEEQESDDPEWVDIDDDDDQHDDATTAPKVPAALPMRKRKRPLQPIRTRGSGEWFYADPPDREPLVKRRYGIAPPALLLVLGLLVVALIVFMIPTLLSGGDGGQTAAVSPSADATGRPVVTRAPVVVTTPSPEPTATTEPKTRFYRVKSGDTLTAIAQRFGVQAIHLQCINNIRRKNIVVLGARLQIPPEGFSCPPGWRNASSDS